MTRERDTALVAVFFSMGITAKENGKMVNEMVLEDMFGQMELNTLGVG